MRYPQVPPGRAVVTSAARARHVQSLQPDKGPGRRLHAAEAARVRRSIKLLARVEAGRRLGQSAGVTASHAELCKLPGGQP